MSPLFRQLSKLRGWLDLHHDIFKELDHPSWRGENHSSHSRYFYHVTCGELAFKTALVEFLTQRLHLGHQPEKFEYYFNAFISNTFFAESLDKSATMPRIRIAKSYSAKLTKGEHNALCREVYFGLISLLQQYRGEDWIKLLTEQYFIHYFFNITFPSPSKRPVRDWCLALAEKRYGKDSIRESVTTTNDEQVKLRLLAGDEELVSLDGRSIKTLRDKAYKLLLIQILDSEADGGRSGVEVIYR